MDYATYLRVKAEMAAHHRLMQEREFPNEANGWRHQPNVLQRILAELSDVLRSSQPTKRTLAAEVTTEYGRQVTTAQ